MALLSAALSAREQAGVKEPPASTTLLDSLRAAMDAESFALARSRGAAMSVDDAAVHARTLFPVSATAAGTWSVPTHSPPS